MTSEKKKDKTAPVQKRKALKIGGLWIDSSSFPALDDNGQDLADPPATEPPAPPSPEFH
jgi:hypothetical protein